jgi:cytochrome oxidase assembly protein ShyY1
LLTPRWLGLHALTVVLVLLMAWLGWWQLGRAQYRPEPGQSGGSAQADQAPAPLGELTAPRRSLPVAAVGRLATATGTYDADRQLLVVSREQAGRSGFWLLTPLRQANGAALPVVRGWVADAGDPAVAAPSGHVTVTGRLQPSEPPGPPEIELPAGQIRTVTTAELVSALPYPLYDGYLLLAAQSPPTAAALTPAPVAPPPPPVRLNLRNFAYALQWWAFALFTVFLWGRLLRDRRRDILASRIAEQRAEDPAQDRGVTA